MTERNNRASFKSSNYGRCVTLTDPEGRTREFHIPGTSSGVGYVREGSNTGQQVCDRLHHTGSTLTASPSTLLDVIRREWRRRWRADRA